MTVAERVGAGAAWLDQHEPGWADRIDLDSLDLSQCVRCVLGQLYGDYIVAVERYFHDDDEIAYRHGFEVDSRFLSPRDVANEFAELAAVWRPLILSRREVLTHA